MKNKGSQTIIYRMDNGQTKLQVTIEEETAWLSQQLMAELFSDDQAEYHPEH